MPTFFQTIQYLLCFSPRKTYFSAFRYSSAYYVRNLSKKRRSRYLYGLIMIDVTSLWNSVIFWISEIRKAFRLDYRRIERKSLWWWLFRRPAIHIWLSIFSRKYLPAWLVASVTQFVDGKHMVTAKRALMLNIIIYFERRAAPLRW